MEENKMKNVVILFLCFMLTGCGSEKREIARQEQIIDSFLEVYFDVPKYSDSICKNFQDYSPEFYNCIQEMIEETHSDILSEEAVGMVMNLTSTNNIMMYINGVDYEVEYELSTPDTLDFPNVFKVLVTHTINGEKLCYFINIKVENDLIVELKDANY